MVNFLTFDIEDWYHANYQSVDFSKYRSVKSRLEQEVDQLLQICDDAGVKATCFVLAASRKSTPGW